MVDRRFFKNPVFLLARTGIEPVRPFTGPGILSPVRLPVSPPGRGLNLFRRAPRCLSEELSPAYGRRLLNIAVREN